MGQPDTARLEQVDEMLLEKFLMLKKYTKRFIVSGDGLGANILYHKRKKTFINPILQQKEDCSGFLDFVWPK